ncbi:hypothetical protein A2U01_0065543, partial [Trifolium medium]|nr:hypothetical protein [Trifolium medium]
MWRVAPFFKQHQDFSLAVARCAEWWGAARSLIRKHQDESL